MKITLTIQEAFDKCYDIDDLCNDIGLNPWCINEGLAYSSDEISIDIEVAIKHGLLTNKEE